MARMPDFNLLVAYRAFRNAMKGGSCSLVVSDSNAFGRIEAEFMWRLRTSRRGPEWMFCHRIDPEREEPGMEEHIGRMIAGRARGSFAQQFPNVTAEAPADFSDSAY